MSGETWGEWLVNGPAWTVVGGAVAWVGNLLWQRRVHSDELGEKKQSREERLVDHTNSLAIELLKLAQADAASLRSQISDLSRGDEVIAWQAANFEEALQHVEALLYSKQSGDQEAAEHGAKLFMARVAIFRQAKGVAANREQAGRASRKLIGKDEE